jgi:hypothetical protein
MELNFFSTIFEKYPHIKLHKFRPVESELFHADGRADRRTDITKLIVAFRNFGNAPKMTCAPH